MSEVALPVSRDLERLFDGNVETVFGFLLGRCGDRALAEDLTAETFLAASRRFDEGAGRDVTPSWLLTVARRRLIDHWRRTSTRSRGLEQIRHAATTPETPDTDPDGHIEVALGSLPPRQRAALVLRYMDGFSTSEVAASLGSSYKATESLLARAREAFRTAYEGETHG